jgi:hypothetical protein
MTTKNEEVLDEEVIEEEEVGEERPKRRRGGEYEVVLDVEDLAIKEALKDVLAVNEEVPKEPHIKDPELAELLNFKQACEALMELLKPYLPQDQDIDILSEDFDLKKAMQLARKMVGINSGEEEVIEGEPSPYAQELFRKIWQKYIDCRWFFAMMKGRKPTTHKDLKFVKAPEELLKISGEKI